MCLEISEERDLSPNLSFKLQFKLDGAGEGCQGLRIMFPENGNYTKTSVKHLET
jgi:hypothetical protein